MADYEKDFIKKANKIHNNKYDYSIMDYIWSKDKVRIICPTHGEFEQTPMDHLRNNGCKKCGNHNRKIKENQNNSKRFLEKAREVHQNKYNYSSIDYINAHTEVKIVCLTHGEFWQKPNIHLNGYGCRCCGKEKSVANLIDADFVARAIKIHNNKYDYSKTNYKNNHTEVKIICPTHGEFRQVPSTHLRGSGCSKCKSKQKINTEIFIEKSTITHQDKYDYSKSEYKNSKSKIIIICKIHGEFEQNPRTHMCGGGCRKCSGKHKLTTKEFIEKAKLVHGDRYDYSNTKYVNNKDKIKIICPTHGEFEQAPKKHLAKQRCPGCGKESLSKKNKCPTNKFVEKANLIYGNKYDYSLVEYNRLADKIKIICPTHGEFEQTASEHLVSKHGCQLCARIKATNKLRFDTEIFIKRPKPHMVTNMIIQNLDIIEHWMR